MPASRALVRAGAIVAASASVVASLVWTVAGSNTRLPLAPPGTRTVAIGADVVATLQGAIRTTRRGRVAAVLVEPGERIAAGDAVFEFEDLALIDSRASLEREIAALREQAAEEPDTELADVRAEGQAVRRAALLHLEETYRLAREEFGRWQSLYDQGLVARLEYEQKARSLAELETRLDQARAAARREPTGPTAPAEPEAPPELRRSERLLARLADLPATFFVKSPWGGTVAAIHCGTGEEPRRGEPLATLDRFARPRVRADVGSIGPIVALESVCGTPGPFGFTLRNGTLETLAPSPGLRPGDDCTVVAAVRK